MGKPKAEKRNDKRQWKHKAKERKRLRRMKHHGQRKSKIYLDYACEGGIINVKEENCKTTIDKGKFCDVTCNRAKSGGRVVKRGKKNKVLVKDKLSPENTFGETASGETIQPPEIRLLHASENGEIDMEGSTLDFVVETKTGNVILYDANNEGTINVNKSTHNSDVKLGPTGNCDTVTAVGGKFSGKGAKLGGKVSRDSPTGNVAEGALSLAGIPSATETTPAETSASPQKPAQKISVPLRSISKKLAKHGQFEPDAKVVDKRADIKKIFGEEGEIQLFYKVKETEIAIDESISFRQINEIDGIIVVKTEVICTSAASVNKVPQIA